MLALEAGHTPDTFQESLVRLTTTAALALPLLFAASMAGAASGSRARPLFCTIGAALLVGLYGFWLLRQPHPLPSTEIARGFTLFLAAHLAASFAPFLARGRDRELSFWRYNETLFLRFLLTSLYTVVLYGGLALALLSGDRLLGLDLDDNLYGHLWLLLAGIFHPLFFLAGVPADPAAVDDSRPLREGTRRFVHYVLVPLVGLYLAILYLYGGLIAARGQLPNGWVGLPVLILASCGGLAVLLFRPWALLEPGSWARRFERLFFALLLPLMPLLALSIGRRVDDYGLTEERVYVLLLTAWLTAIAAWRVWRPATSIKTIPLSLAIVALLVSLGPWSASALAFRSQHARLAERLEHSGLWRDGALTPLRVETPPDFDVSELIGDLHHVARRHGPGALDPWHSALPATADVDPEPGRGSHYSPYVSVARLVDHLELRTHDRSGPPSWQVAADIAELPLPAPARVRPVSWYGGRAAGEPTATTDLGHGWSIRFAPRQLTVHGPDGASSAWSPASLPGGPLAARDSWAADDLRFSLRVGPHDIVLLVTQAHGEWRGSARTLNSIQLLVALPPAAAR